MTEIDAIKARHSVRKYQNRKIEPEKAEKLNEMISACNTYNKFFSKAMGLGSAPSVIACES